ncbi:MAG: LCP family protein [Oscillospiraceae bacterium]|nr:LCP family protein [Oscillospiraceae bacterium]
MKLFGGNGRRSGGTVRPVRAQIIEMPDNELFGDSRGHNSRDAAPPPKNGRPPRKKGRGAIIALLVIVLLAFCAFAYWKITTKPPEQNEPVEPETNNSDVAVERYYTLLVVGDDQEGGNTDTIMVLRFDTQEMKVNVVSIPRDTMVNSTLDNKKINAVYHNLDGMNSLLDEVQSVAGFRPNNYIMVDTDVFVDVVDALGGVDFNVPISMDYDDWSYPDGNGGYKYEFHIHVAEGQQTLSGYDALGVFRFRQNNNGTGYAMGDIQRLEVQHQLLMSIAQKAMDTRNVVTLYNIASSVMDKCETDLSMGNIQWYIKEFMNMSLENISFFTAPTTGCEVYKTSYVTINANDWIDMVNTVLNPFDTTIQVENCEILNQTGGTIDGRGYLVAEPRDFYCTNGAAVNTNFYDNRK